MSDSDDDDSDIYKAKTFGQLIIELLKKVTTVPTDLRQDRYCRYINSILSLYGEEQCILVGSTKERTRLRSNQDQGDHDYLMISEILISTKYLQYNDKVPCYVRIDGTKLHDELPVELIDGIYLPGNLLRTVSSEAFTGLRGLFSLVSLVSTFQGQHTLHINIDAPNKPGVTLTNYTDWMCDELPVRPKSPNIDTDKVYGLFYERIRNSPFLMHTNTKVIQVLRKLALLAITLSDDIGAGAQLFQYLSPLVNAVTDCINSSTTASHHTRSSTLNTTNAEEELRSTEHSGCEEVFYASYRWKSLKRCIAAFPLDGPPKHMDTWKARTCDKAWPGVDVVSSICKSDFFVVCKPLAQGASDKTEFCLSYVSAEIQLSACMYPVQRKCLLVIKAFQSSKLEEYSDKLTTFHWKTALYWVSEGTALSQIADDSDENVLSLVRNVVDFMLTSLRKSNLQHYFNPSNIIGHLDVMTISKVVDILTEVLDDPVDTLREYFRYEEINSSVRTIEVTRSQMEQLQNSVHADTDRFVIDMIVSALEQFVREPPQSSDDEPLFKKAVLKVAEAVCSDLTKDLVGKGRPLMVPVDRIMKTFETFLTAQESKTQDTMFALFTVFRLSGLLKEL
ncbi:uncharacterized protein LOC110446012 [Mizuhopecten yessoensis]|uniref:Mab-21-like HhH/H2TH-like domain-containing protein n=1 Tax=Mizuhopecten yessoensis TaxID=6573 RepID=A0A210QYE7_MIZYE|nr:uncharacterized protein LOC110446012 [Mizuhopecten yessoensis]OWF53722.1 hypothetical protein KP79_PYT05743 [Mizuhopecten yessoensis]